MDYQTENGDVICAICGKTFKVITSRHLKKIHNMSLGEYKIKYPNAAIIGERTIAKRKYKRTEMFKEKKKPIILESDNLYDEIKYVMNTEELDNKEIKNSAKKEIFNVLKERFPNVIPDYTIKKLDMQGRLEYSIITDIADPVNKIDFEFSETFWHNPGFYYVSPVRENMLQENGWKVITFKGKHLAKDELLKKLDLIF